jgi:DNA-directed RNA polymerase subunit RPC12/RpoP
MPKRFIIYLAICTAFIIAEFLQHFNFFIDFLFIATVLFILTREYFILFRSDRRPDVPEYRDLVVFETFYNSVEANLLKEYFEQNGIDAVVSGGMFGAIDPLIITAIGGLRLQIPKDQVDKAKECYALYKEAHLTDPVIVCPQCGSTNIKEVYKKWPFTLFFVLLTSTPPPNEISFKCRECGNEWKKLKEIQEKDD